MQAANRFKIKATPVFYATKKAMDEGYPIIVNEGGSRSSKTYSEVQLLIHIADTRPGIRITMCSHSLPHVKKGIYRDFTKIMKEWNLWQESQFSYTDFIYTFTNGSYIEMFGLDDPTKAHGPSRDILFINEANLISKALFDQLAMRTTGQILLDLNPSEFNSWVYKLADTPGNKKIHSTYRNNLTNLSPNQIAIIEGYKDLPDDFMHKVYALGLRGASKETIYTHWKTGQGPGKGDIFYGLDFGYVHPCAMVRVETYEGDTFVDEILYRQGMTLTEMAQFIKSLNTGYSPIYADAAEPKSIEEIFRYGINILPAVKDVWAGILTMKAQRLYLNGKNLISEFGSYKWKTDKDGNVLEEPVKLNDDLCDAARYAIHTHLEPKIQMFTF